ncbi:MAG: hypothetical protein ACLS61_00430 [Ruminococcus sp.]
MNSTLHPLRFCSVWLCVGISVVVPKENRVPTAKTTLTEALETAAEAEAAQQEEFPIYSQDSNYDEILRLAARTIVPTITAMILLAVILLTATRSLILLRILEIAREVTLRSDIPDYTEDTSDDSGQDNNENWDYIDNGDGSGSDSEGDYTEDTSDQDIEYYE